MVSENDYQVQITMLEKELADLGLKYNAQTMQIKLLKEELADLKAELRHKEEVINARCQDLLDSTDKLVKLKQLVGELIDEWDKDYGDMASVIDKLKQTIGGE